MTAARRWLVVGLSTLLLVSIPVLLRALPVSGGGADAADLLEQVQQSTSKPYSGYAESTGGLALPVTGQFTELSDLLGDLTTMRVWWRSPTSYRVDTVTPAGESDLYLDETTTFTWDYERARVTVQPDGPVRFPRAADLLPTELGQRLLSEARPDEVSLIAPQRIAGRSAPGLRLTPADTRSTIDRVDVWVDPDSGLPLQVSMYSAGTSRAAVSTRFLDFASGRPAAATTRFSVPPGVTLDLSAPNSDLESVASRFSQTDPPPTLAGMPRRDRAEGLGPIGTYGRGTAVLVAVRLSGRIVGPLREQLSVVPGALVDEAGVAVTIGPIGLSVAPQNGFRRGGWVVAGTVDLETLKAAGAELAAQDGES